MNFRERMMRKTGHERISLASHQSAQEDVCFPAQEERQKDQLDIDFDYLEDFIADQRLARIGSHKESDIRVFSDLRRHGSTTSVVSAPGTIALDELGSLPNVTSDDMVNLFFSSAWESTIHAAELGDLVLPGEDLRNLFILPRDEDGVWWLNVNNPSKEEVVAICKAFGAHPLTTEDIATQETREKIELFPSYYFACFRSFSPVPDDDGYEEYEPFNIYAIVFREGTLSFSFAPNSHADWICYALMACKKNIIALMRLISGKADVLKGFTKRCNENYKVTPRMDIGLYLGDIQDHVVTMMTNLGHFEKMLTRAHSNYLTQLSISNIRQVTETNASLSKITFLASVLVPLNLISGTFGMNVTVPFQTNESLAPFFGIIGVMIVDADLSRLNDKDKAELRQFLSLESKRSEVQANTHALTEVCWKKCITSASRGPKLDKTEESCLTNCVERILDINFLTVKHLEKLRQ
ncbi:unnamed protein product [Parascedosporium putredinis]|uniref:Tim10-like domain-containing protein n=1 Tax=Parascedosporium putredinis TaxID=1442378 RepID=A0A9P1M7S8_9PEZI|nr:unnamed protein product [Parascedosporium putredinis]CAI7988549.1 unnamed protein product [Parascedosporium putredinis]